MVQQLTQLLIDWKSFANFEKSQDFVLQLQRFMFEVHARARTNLKGAAKNQEKQYNNRLKFHTYEIGSFVYYYYPVKVNVSKESYLKWKGPYKIVSKVTDTLYRIKSGDGGKSFIVHYNKLKPAHTSAICIRLWASPAK